MNDIDLESNEWTPIGTNTAPFTGTLDGKDFTITNLKITTSQVYVGLFGYNEGTIKNLKFANVDINVTGGLSANIYGGAFIGYNNSNSDLENLHTLSGIIYIKKRGTNEGTAGGLIGYQITNQSIINSSNNVNITGELLDATGGVVGKLKNSITISNSSNSGSVTSANMIVGGLIGNGNSATITNSMNSGNVSGSSVVGGLIGVGNSATITNSMNSGNVSGSSGVGGLIGVGIYATITNSMNSGNVSASGWYVGGLIGEGDSTTITNSTNSGNVSGIYFVGGLVGNGSESITNSMNSGNVTGASGYVGGLIGYSYSITITNSMNSGNVSASGYVGGLIGDGDSATITNSYNSGQVSGIYYVGGLIGNLNFSLYIYYSANFGNVVSTTNTIAVGGITGFLPAINDIEQSYYSGSITSNGVAVDGIAFGTKVTDLSTFNLAFFTTTLEWDTEIWDFTGLDIVNGVYPTLRNMPEIPVEE
jgi:hypothetical protein